MGQGEGRKEIGGTVQGREVLGLRGGTKLCDGESGTLWRRRGVL